jgi:hypothetical protein
MTRKPAARKTKTRKFETRESKAVKSKALKSKTKRRAKAPARPSRIKSPDTIDAMIAGGTTALALPMEAAWQAGVRFNLQLLLRHAALIDAFPLSDEAEPAPVFRA